MRLRTMMIGEVLKKLKEGIGKSQSSQYSFYHSLRQISYRLDYDESAGYDGL